MKVSPSNMNGEYINKMYDSYILHLSSSNLSHTQEPDKIEIAQQKVWTAIESKLSPDKPRRIFEAKKIRLYTKNLGFAFAGGMAMLAVLFFIYPPQAVPSQLTASDIEFPEQSMQEFQLAPVADGSLQFQLPEETEFIIQGSPVLYSQ